MNKYRFYLLVYAVLIVISGYHAIAFIVWQYRNPKANGMTFYSRYMDVIAWHKLPEFQ